MKSFLVTSSCLLALITGAGCGKKANESDKRNESFIQPSEAELYFNAFKEIERSVNENDLAGLQKAILDNPGVDLNITLTDGETFLIKAIKKNYIEIRDFLLEKNCNVEKASINKETPLIAAVTHNRVNSVKILLDLKVDMKKKNSDGDTALHIALKKRNEELALLLLREDPSVRFVEITDQQNRNALRLAEEMGLTNALELIKSILQVEAGAPDMASFRNILIQGDYRTLNTIVTRYPRIASDYEMINPLALLVEVKNENTAISSAELLLQHNANVNGPKDAETTPLIKATVTQKKAFAHLYLTANANPQLLDKEGKSALIHAIELNNSELVDLLLSYSAVEKYTFRKDGKKITYDSCKVAKNKAKTLTVDADKKINKQIQNSLDCGFLSWLF